MNRQEKILKEYISEVLSTRSALDERVFGSAKKAASGIVKSVKGIFSGGSKGSSWAEKQFSLFKKEVGDKAAKRAGVFFNKIFDKFIPERMINTIPAEWIELMKKDIAAVMLAIPNSEENDPNSKKKPYASYTTPNEVRRIARRMIESFEDKIIRETLEEIGEESKKDVTRQDVESAISQEDVDRIRKKVIEDFTYTIESWTDKDYRSRRKKAPGTTSAQELLKKWKGPVLEILNEIKIDKKYHPLFFREVMKFYLRENNDKKPYISFADEGDVKEVTLKIREMIVEELKKIPQSTNLDENILMKMLEKILKEEKTIALVKEWEENIKEEDE